MCLAALDIGSGAMKLDVAWVATSTPYNLRIVGDLLHSEQVKRFLIGVSKSTFENYHQTALQYIREI